MASQGGAIKKRCKCGAIFVLDEEGYWTKNETIVQIASRLHLPEETCVECSGKEGLKYGGYPGRLMSIWLST